MNIKSFFLPGLSLALIWLLLPGCSQFSARTGNKGLNQLTNKEKKEGWVLLFDGEKPEKWWHSPKKDDFPEKGWTVKDGTLTVLGSEGGSIMTYDKYGSFELKLDFRLTTGANSGIKYFVRPTYGLEYQILDDKSYPGEEFVNNGIKSTASLYELIPPQNKILHPAGEWNHARIVAKPDNHVEHWLNGEKVLEYKRGSEDFRNRVAKSKFSAPWYNEHEPFGELKEGHILLQDHDCEVSFRNIKIRRLD